MRKTPRGALRRRRRSLFNAWADDLTATTPAELDLAIRIYECALDRLIVAMAFMPNLTEEAKKALIRAADEAL